MRVAEAGQSLDSGRRESGVSRLGCCTLLLHCIRSKSAWLLHFTALPRAPCDLDGAETA